eukprot:446846-Lingulodinium_polyedra.AAC.1
MTGMTGPSARDIALYLKPSVALRSPRRARTPAPDAAIAGGNANQRPPQIQYTRLHGLLCNTYCGRRQR